MALSVDPKAYVIGPAFPYFRDVGVLTPWSFLGVLLDDAVMRVVTRWFRPDNLSGVMGPIKGLDVLAEVNAEAEWTMPELIGTKFGKAVPGARITTETGADAGGTPLSTDLDGAVSAGATSINVTAATNGAVGDWIRIEADAAATCERRQITEIAGTVLSFRDPLIFAHADAAVVVEIVDGKRIKIEAPVVRRQPDTAYDAWALVAESGKSTPTELRIPIGISQTETAEVTIGDEALSGIRMTVGARYDGDDLSISPFQLFGPSA
jgi:hypothetical protein